jgi:N-acetylglucosaminyl-diphospho-decaprenol L-rhamnosyltransferase
MTYKQPTVSITVVAFNSAHCLRACLRSVRRDVLSGFAEVFVVDNDSPDDCASIVESEFPEVELIRSSSNRQYAGGCNLAWPHTRGQYWLLLNPDCVVPEGQLTQLAAWMDEHPEVGAASPQLVDSDGRAQSVGRRFQSIMRSLLETSRLHLLLPARQRSNLFLGAYWDGREHTAVDWVPGAALIARREAVDDAGLLSEDVLFYAEDSEWCWRIRKAGWRIGVCGDVTFQHDEGQSTARTWSDDERSRRMWLGTYDASRKMRGVLYARMLAIINTFAFVIEAANPRRSTDQRTESWKRVRAHVALLKNGSIGHRHG